MARVQKLTSGLILAAAVSSAAQAIEFTEVPSSVSGLDYVGETWGASWGDFNGDRYPDLYSSNHRARPSIWRNNGDGTFTDVVIQFDTSYTWLDNPILDTHGGAWGDFDNDGVQDLFVTTGSVFPTQLFVNKGVGVAVDETVARSVPDDREGRTAMWWDYDNDGLLDMLMANGAPNIVAKQTDGQFTDTTADVGLDSFRSNYGQLSDVDLDDHMELFTVPDGDFPRKVYKTDADIWTDITDTLPTSGLVIDAAFADFNNDLTPDILLVRGSLRPNQALKVTDGDTGEQDKIEWYVDGGYSSGERGLLFQAEGPITVTVHSTIGYPRYFIGADAYTPLYTTTFTLDPELVSDQGIYPHDETVDQAFYFGYDVDTSTWQIFMSPGGRSTRGYLEITGVDMSDPIQTNIRTGDEPINPKLFLNDGGTAYVDTSGIGLSFSISCVATAVGDFDNDMDQDIYMVCRNGIENIANRLYVNDGTGFFTEAADFGAEGVLGTGLDSGAGVGENVVTADYDLDGWLDLYVLNGLLMNPLRVGGPDQLFRNTSSETSDNRWLLLDLVGTVSNRDAIGAKVIVTSGGVSQLRERTGNHHRWSQNHTRLHVGLGQNDTADIEVRWPNGEVDIFTDVSANDLYEITQGTGGSQTGVLAAVAPTATPAFPAAEPGDECGVHPDDQPETFPYSFDSAQDLGMFLWKDCENTQQWFVRASAGGVDNVIFQGSFVTNGTFSSVEEYSLENNNDYVEITDSNRIDFQMGIGGSGIDGVNFVIDDDANACFDMSIVHEGAGLYIGKGHIPITAPINLVTMEPCIDIVAEEVTASEGDGTALIPVNISSVSQNTITVDYSLIADTAFDGSDFVAGAGTLTFEPGTTTATIEVALVDDTIFEQSESFTVELSNASGAFVFEALSTVTIEDDETCLECGEPSYDPSTDKALYIWKDFATEAWHVSGAGGGDGNGVFFEGFVSSSQPFVSVEGVSIEPTDVLDFTTSTDTIDYVLKVWNSGEDGFIFMPEESALTCFNPTGPSDVTVYVGASKTEMTGAFDINTLGPCLEVSVSDVTASEGDEAAVFTVTLSEEAADAVMVDYYTEAGSATADVDYTDYPTAQTLTFEAGETIKTVEIPIIQDDENESDETFTFYLTNPVNVTIGTLAATATITDDEVNACGEPSFVPEDQEALFVWEDCDTGEWSVYATGGGNSSGVFYEGTVTSEDGFDSITEFRMEANDTADNTTDSTEIAYLLKVWNRDLDAFLFTPTTKETTCLSLDGPAGTPILAGLNKLPLSSPFNISTLGPCESVIVDISVDDIEVSEAETEAVFTVSLSQASGATVTVDYVTLGDTATGDADYVEVTTPTTITFEPGVTEQQIVVTLLPDDLSEDVTETFTVELSSATNAAIIDASGTADILDDEINACGRPDYDASSDQNIYIWRTCGTNTWTVNATAGGSSSRVDYIGEFVSSQDITGVELISIESNDVVDNSADPSVLQFTNYMRNSGYDGFSFTVGEGASTCFTVDPASNGSGTVIVGAAQTAFATPIDLSTLGACP